ncbi:hypothetical protein CASFOL_000079 [Castilleja foliolosa]|uniref:GATA transcription factor n=1 Tax=Castilleja foliolosa TaxID=1961234 RepID=A0ABD3EMX1_9LAMI
METPEFLQTSYCNNAQFNTEKNGDRFMIEDLLNFPNDESMAAADGGFEAAMIGTSSAATTVVDNNGNSDFQAAGIGGPGDAQFASDICVPYDDMADELEWLSKFVDESFSSSEDLQKLHLIQGTKARTNEPSETHQYQFQPETTRPGPLIPTEMSVPAKARSKRSRSAPENWTSRLLVVSPPPLAAMSSSSESDVAPAKKPMVHKKKETPSADNSSSSGGSEGRRCLHCDTDKTPQWRTGPMGPKTLCNACGVRYKSGRLVPEYRPASSPTFVLTKHSNSHRKVLELRRQKEMQRAQQHHQQFLHHHHQNMLFDVSNADDYLIHQHIGPDYRQMI